MVSFDKLIQNDDFIKWARSKDSPNNEYWEKLKSKSTGKEKKDFDEAYNLVLNLSNIDVNKGFRVQSENTVELGLLKLKQDSSKYTNSRVINLNAFIKYAAVILLFLSIGYISYLQISKPKDIFDNQLVESRYATNKILFETTEGDFYEIPNNSKTWKTEEGIILNVSKDKIVLSKLNELAQIESSNYKIHVPYRKQYEVVLIDETSVKLNANTVFEFNTDTNSKERKVKIIGEGYFDVAHNESRPFIVSADKMDIKVLGTEFNITAYRNENTIETTLIHGSVQVTNLLNSEEEIIKPGDVAVLNKIRGDMNVDKANLNKTMFWVSEVMILNNNKLEDICDQLGRWYGVYFEYGSTKLKNNKYSGELRKDMELHTILEKLKYSEGINYSIDKKTIRLSN